MAQADIRNVSATTKRLVQRCLSATWAIEAKKEHDAAMSSAMSKPRKSHENRASAASLVSDLDSRAINAKGNLLPTPKAHPLRDLKFSKSVDVLTLDAREEHRREHASNGLNNGDREEPKQETLRKSKGRLREGSVHDHRRGSNDSSFSFADVASIGAPVGNMRLLTSHGGNLLIKTVSKPMSSKLRRESNLSNDSTDSSSLKLSSPQSTSTTSPEFERTTTPLASPPPTPTLVPSGGEQVRRYRPAPLPPSSPPSPPTSQSSISSSLSPGTKSRKTPPAIPSRSGKSVFRKNNSLTNHTATVSSMESN